MSIRVGINGFGRIGRAILRAGIDNKDVEFVGINDLTTPETLAFLLQYDSVHGRFGGTVSVDGNDLIVNGKRIPISAERNPSKITWGDWGAELVMECTGLFLTRESASQHLAGGAKWVLLSAPAKKDEDITVAYGVNHTDLDIEKHKIISNASCTTNCLAPMAKVLNDSFGIEHGLMTTIHSYTNNQAVLDSPHEKDWRRGRAAAVSMIPTTTGAAAAVGKVLPVLKGKLDGMAVRVPTPNVSLTDLTSWLSREVSVEEIQAAMKEAANGALKGVLEYSDIPLVSIDMNGNPHSSIFIADQIRVQGRMVKTLSWYDNEWGYSCRMIDVAAYIGAQR